jgi:hypothetical protein
MMPTGMPYHLEKGGTLRLLEKWLNKPSTNRPALIEMLRTATAPAAWIEHPLLDGFWGDAAFNIDVPLDPNGGIARRTEIIRNWFGHEGVPGNWQKVEKPTTGYWIAYNGEVEEIMRRALVWALELSLGVGPGQPVGSKSRSWDIEFYWKCPCPWFEAWVLQRPVEAAKPKGRGVVSVVFLTPSHKGSNVAESPIATAAKTMTVGGPPHPVPSTEPHYQVIRNDGTLTPVEPTEPHERQYAMWVATHEDHTTTGTEVVTVDTTSAADFQEWGIPQLNIYAGMNDVVVVSPSMAAGGVKQGGEA